ncbi:hypothetical protein FACS189413_03170 [Bacteroidia bacterium]|nr:hypothetical protein FACS189413_03170 [Bacteroidia bacterium]
MNKILFYDSYFTGHHSEYVNNILTYFSQYPPINQKVYLAIHQKVEEMLDLKNTEIKNIEIVLLPNDVNEKRFFGKLDVIKQITDKYGINHVILLWINSLMLDLAFGKYRFVVSGIVFYPFNPHYEKYSLFMRIQKEIMYFLVSKRQKIKKLFILNDQKTCIYLNRHFHTHKFQYLPDPIPLYEQEKLPDEIMEITKKRKIILHFGAMSERKGTLLILDTITTLSSDIIAKTSFFFVGKPINEAFGKLLKDRISQLQTQFLDISIFYNPCFVSVGQMESYYELSNFVLMPYLSNNMSSGVLGHAAKHNKPVITGKGLLGELVKQYHLGIAIEPCTKSLKYAISTMLTKHPNNQDTKYVDEHTCGVFVETLF